MTSGGNNFNDFPENRLTKSRAVYTADVNHILLNRQTSKDCITPQILGDILDSSPSPNIRGRVPLSLRDRRHDAAQWHSQRFSTTNKRGATYAAVHGNGLNFEKWELNERRIFR